MRCICLSTALIAALISGPGLAETPKKWRFGGGVQIERYSGISGNVGITEFNRNATKDTVERSTLSAEYRLNSRIGVGVDFALPAELNAKGAQGGIRFKTSGATVMGRYYTELPREFRPFVGLGLTYSRYTKEYLYNSPSEAKPDIENSLAPTIAFGMEFPSKNRETFRAEISYHRSAPKLLVHGRPSGEIKLSPINLSLSYLARF